MKEVWVDSRLEINVESLSAVCVVALYRCGSRERLPIDFPETPLSSGLVRQLNKAIACRTPTQGGEGPKHIHVRVVFVQFLLLLNSDSNTIATRHPQRQKHVCISHNPSIVVA